MDLSDLTIDDLDIDLTPPPSRGRKALPLVHSLDRELTAEDILDLQAEGNGTRGSETPSIQKLRQSHHKLAMLLAEGRSAVECSLITGYAQSRISLLQKDPAFKQLLDHYKGVHAEVYINVHERLAGFSLDALEELQERLETAPEKFSNSELMSMIPLGFDRAGFGPKSTQVHEHTLSVDSLLEGIKDEIRKKQDGRIKTLDARSDQSQAQSGAGNSLGLKIEGEAGQYPAIETPRGESGRQEVRESSGGETAPSTGTESRAAA